MTRFSHILLYTALIFMMIASAGNARAHVCLDGQEPPSFVYFENFGGDPFHQHGDEAHDDIENELTSKLMSGKAPQQDVPLLLLAYSLLMPAPQPATLRFSAFLNQSLYRSAPQLRPPARAPPL